MNHFLNLISGFLIMMTLFTTSYSQSVQISTFNEFGSGMILKTTDQIDLIDYYENIIHTVNVSDHQTAFDQIKLSASNLPGQTPSIIERENYNQ